MLTIHTVRLRRPFMPPVHAIPYAAHCDLISFEASLCPRPVVDIFPLPLARVAVCWRSAAQRACAALYAASALPNMTTTRSVHGRCLAPGRRSPQRHRSPLQSLARPWCRSLVIRALTVPQRSRLSTRLSAWDHPHGQSHLSSRKRRAKREQRMGRRRAPCLTQWKKAAWLRSDRRRQHTAPCCEVAGAFASRHVISTMGSARSEFTWSRRVTCDKRQQ